MAQELKTKTSPSIQHNSSNLAHYSALFREHFESDSIQFEHNSRFIRRRRDNWRYGLATVESTPNFSILFLYFFKFKKPAGFFISSRFTLLYVQQIKLVYEILLCYIRAQ